jgi:hypothetical protein
MVDVVTKVIDENNVRIVPLLGTHSVRLFAKVRKAFAPALIMALSSVKEALSTPVKSPTGKKPASKDEGKKLAEERRIEIAKKLLGSKIDFNAISKAISSISDNMTPDEELVFFREALATTYIDEKSVADDAQFNFIFQGRVLLLYKVLWATLEVNYGDFFGMVAGIGGTSPDADPATTEAPTTK